MMKKETMKSVLKFALKNTRTYTETLEIVQKNAVGSVWLVGGAVSRLILQRMDGKRQEKFDFDFVCDKLATPLTVPTGWSVSHNKFDNPTFSKGQIEIDIWPINTHTFIQRNKLSPTINNYLKGVPFTVQSIAYNVKTEELMGKNGINAIKNRKVGVNNITTARILAQNKGTTIDEVMKKKASSIGLTVIPCNE